MLDPHDSARPEPSNQIDLEIESLSSAALARVIEEVSSPADPAQMLSTSYNRTYHRHNR